MKKYYGLLSLSACLLCLLGGQVCLAQTGTVLGFGNNASGQVGNGTIGNGTNSSSYLLPTPALNISGIKAIASSGGHTLALDSRGTVWAWGYNGAGQLGDGTTETRLLPVPVLGGIKAIAANGADSMALDAKGQVWVWGYNFFAELGTGDRLQQHSPVRMNTQGERIKAISAGDYTTLVLSERGVLYGFGANGWGQLGRPAIGGIVEMRTSLTHICDGVVAMAAGPTHTLVQFADNTVYETGFNGDASLFNESLPPAQGVLTYSLVYCMSNARSIAASDNQSFVVTQEGKVFAWGRNSNGELGLGDRVQRLVPTLVPGLTNIKAVSSGYNHTLVLTAGGKVLAAGNNGSGQLGDGTRSSRATFAPIKNVAYISSISAGWFSSALLKPFTNILGTGLNNRAQLGLGHFRQEVLPTNMGHVNSNNYIAVATGNTGGMHSLALRADGIVIACGMNSSGQLGIGTYADSVVPVEVKGPGGEGYLANIIALAAGNDFSLALAADGTVYAWGGNEHGQLGLGNLDNQPYPVRIPGVSNVSAIVAGAQYSLLLRDGNVYACGSNNSGQTGLGFADHYASLSQVSGGDHFIALAAGEAHTLGLNCHGEIYAWGRNWYGQLALGDAAQRNFPTLQPGTIAIGIACGSNHSLYFDGGGTLCGSGSNYNAELGLGDTQPRYYWSYNSIATDTIGIAAGQFHSLRTNVFGVLSAAGQGANGQLGNGSTHSQSWFAPVVGLSGTTDMAGGAYHTLILTTPPS